MPLASGKLATPETAWLTGHRGLTPPPRLPIVDYDVEEVLLRCEDASKLLRRYGLSEYGHPDHAWRFLKAAGDIVATGVDPVDGDRILTTAREAWQDASLQEDPPSGIRIIGRALGGVVAAVALEDGQSPPLLVADGDDRQLVRASTRSKPDTVVFEPPSARALEIGQYLAARFPGRVGRASQILAVYESEGREVAFDPQVPFLQDVLGVAIREVLTLSLRYRDSFYQGRLDTELQLLATVRLRWLPELSIRIGGVSEPFPRFAERAVLLNSKEGSVVFSSGNRADSDCHR
jgi:hypothetical protein